MKMSKFPRPPLTEVAAPVNEMSPTHVIYRREHWREGNNSYTIAY